MCIVNAPIEKDPPYSSDSALESLRNLDTRVQSGQMGTLKNRARNAPSELEGHNWRVPGAVRYEGLP